MTRLLYGHPQVRGGRLQAGRHRAHAAAGQGRRAFASAVTTAVPPAWQMAVAAHPSAPREPAAGCPVPRAGPPAVHGPAELSLLTGTSRFHAHMDHLSCACISGSLHCVLGGQQKEHEPRVGNRRRMCLDLLAGHFRNDASVQ